MKTNATRRMIRGQAMVEYSTVTFLICCMGLVATSTIPIGVQGPLLKILWNSLNQFYDSVYFVLQCSIP